MQQRITLQDIENKEFAISQNGYNQQEVDQFLDEICDELVMMTDEIKRLQQELDGAHAALNNQRSAPAPAPTPFAPPAPRAATQSETEAFKEILEMAQKVKEDTINAARGRADAIVADAQREAEERLGDLNNQHDRLTQQVAELKHVAQEYRNKFESLLAAQQDALDKASDLF